MASASLHQTFANWVDYPPLNPYATFVFTKICLTAFKNKEFDAPEFDAIPDDQWHGFTFNEGQSLVSNVRELETQCQKQIYDIHMAQFGLLAGYREYLLDGIKLLRFLKHIAGDQRNEVVSLSSHLEKQAKAMRRSMAVTVENEVHFANITGTKAQLPIIMERHSHYIPKTYYIPLGHTEEVIPFIKLQHARMEEKGQHILNTQLGMIQRQMLLYREFAMRGVYPVFPHMPELNEVSPEMRHEFICHRLSDMLEGYSERRHHMQADADSFIAIAHQLFPNYATLIDDKAGYYGQRPKP